MRLFSWFGAAVILTAAGIGYVAGVAHRSEYDTGSHLPATSSQEEEATAPPGLALDLRKSFVEDIDLTCPPNLNWNIDLTAQTMEPPTAQPGILDTAIRQTSFELPSGDGPELAPFMPYCDDLPPAATQHRTLMWKIIELQRQLRDGQ